MTVWANIEIPPNDQEIIRIDEFEKSLGTLSREVRQVRQLISGFEVCHFKCQQHILNIKASIQQLKPCTDPNQIGAGHLRNGKNAWKKDKSGRSRSGWQYVKALAEWLGDRAENDNSPEIDKATVPWVRKWLGERDPEKERLIRLLIARLTWDWESYEALQREGEYGDLEFQVCRMDVCHYAFPAHLERLLQGIGTMEPVEEFEGCGSFNTEIKTYVTKEFSTLNDQIQSLKENNRSDKKEKIRRWLFACLAKTLKEQVGLTSAVYGLD